MTEWLCLENGTHPKLPCCTACVDANAEVTTTLRRVAKPKMVMRSLRVPEKLWDAAKAKADEREENLSDVIREALEKYARRK